MPENSTVSPPPPYVIEPPLTTKIRFLQGDAFDFQLLLFGKINHNFPYFVYAFDQMGKMGIGKHIAGQRGQFSLKAVKVKDQLIYSDSDRELSMIEAFRSLRIGNPANYPQGVFRLRLTLETPLRFKSENHLTNSLPFHVLTRAMLRRISALLSCYGDGNPALNYRGLVEKSADIRMVKNNIEWFDWRRYSQRQEQGMSMGGMIGSAVYEGNIGEFMPFIEFCTKVHLGKQTSFGLGKNDKQT